MKAIYLQCVGGISGDMFLAGLVDIGLPLSVLESVVSQLGISEAIIKAQSGTRSNISGTHLVTEIAEEQHYSMAQLKNIVEIGELVPEVKEMAIKILTRVERGESKTHPNVNENTPLHELGSLDTVIDIVGTVTGLRYLGIERVFSSVLPSGGGVFSSAHGILPAPGPAVLHILSEAGVPIAPMAVNKTPLGEMVTPTGAAIVAEIGLFQSPIMRLKKVGYGLGSKDFNDHPNVLGIWLGEVDDNASARELVVLETNIDDMNPQFIGYIQELLLEKGARDVWCTQIQMKKGRPAVSIQVLCDPNIERIMTDLLFRETTTLGVRRIPVGRYEAERKIEMVETSLGTISIKLKVLNGSVVGVAPEYEDCRKIAQENGVPLPRVHALALQAAYRKFPEVVDA